VRGHVAASLIAAPPIFTAGCAVVFPTKHPEFRCDSAHTYEWIEDGSGYREWLIPAQFINAKLASIRVIEEDAYLSEGAGLF